MANNEDHSTDEPKVKLNRQITGLTLRTMKSPTLRSAPSPVSKI